MSPLLADKVCIITGAGTGIGAASARVFAEEGALLVLAGRTAETLERTKVDVEQAGGKAIVSVTDVSNSEECKRMVHAAIAAFGRIDCAMNNAAIDGVHALTADYPEDTFDQVVSTNLKGVWNCMRFQIPELRKNGGGSILNISSAASSPTQPAVSAYVASKHGVNGLTKTAGLEYAKYNIRINALLLGTVDTPMLRQVFEHYPHFKPALLAEIPAGRLATTEECGQMSAWMLSDRCSYMCGTTVLFDGGFALPQRLGVMAAAGIS